MPRPGPGNGLIIAGTYPVTRSGSINRTLGCIKRGMVTPRYIQLTHAKGLPDESGRHGVPPLRMG